MTINMTTAMLLFLFKKRYISTQRFVMFQSMAPSFLIPDLENATTEELIKLLTSLFVRLKSDRANLDYDETISVQ
jgi:hypothetical protein